MPTINFGTAQGAYMGTQGLKSAYLGSTILWTAPQSGGSITIADVAVAFSGLDYGDFSDAAYTFQDRNQTNPVVSSGNYVRGHGGYAGRIDFQDKDGGSTRPRWRGPDGLEGDGNDRLIISTALNAGPGWFVGLRLKVQELDRLQAVFQIDNIQPVRQNTDNSFLVFGRDTSNNIAATNVPSSTHGIGVGDWVTVMSWQKRNGDIKIYVGEHTATTSLGATSKSFTAPDITMLTSGNADHFNGRITRWCFLPEMDTTGPEGDLSETQITAIKSWLDAG